MLRQVSTFTREEILRYFGRINLPAKYRSCVNSEAAPDLALLRALHIHQIASSPYENLSLHYSLTKTVSLDPHELYTKIVTNGRGRGGYCMENSIFFLHILRDLGFDVYPTGVRIRLRTDGVPSGDYFGLVHMILIITFPNGERYTSDVAFGGDGPTTPLPLLAENEASDHITRNLGTQDVRLVRGSVPSMPPRPSLGGKREQFWIYQYRNGPDKDWNSFYCFQETEFLEQDFNVMNYFTSQGKTFQKIVILVIKFLLPEKPTAEDDTSRIAGKIMMVSGTVKRNLGGRTEIVQECKTEEERVAALKSWFGIILTEEEVDGIKGEVTELKDAEVVVA
jgi:arylamine N-acetyltransferase